MGALVELWQLVALALLFTFYLYAEVRLGSKE